jgi:hypothetical protein
MFSWVVSSLPFRADGFLAAFALLDDQLGLERVLAQDFNAAFSLLRFSSQTKKGEPFTVPFQFWRPRLGSLPPGSTLG